MEGELKGGRYLIQQKIKEGGQGVVYRAQDNRLKCSVAVKVIKPEHLDEPQFRLRLAQEARAAANINHSGIARPLDFVEDGRDVFIVFEYVEGVTLRRMLQEKRFTIAEILDIGVSLAEALAAAHEKGFIHRDLKPENIMLSACPEGKSGVKILDFGLAKRIQHVRTPIAEEAETAPSNITSSRELLIGTMGYMSPEQLGDTKAEPLDAKTDIFSLGLILYEMATGRNPFWGDTSVSTIRKILTMELTPLAELNPVAPRQLDQVLQKCLRKRREERYQTARQLLSALENIRRERDVAAQQEKPEEPSHMFWIPRRAARALFLFIQFGYLVMYGVAFHLFLAAVERLNLLVHFRNASVVLGLCTVCGTAMHLYLLAAVVQDYPNSGRLFRRMFPVLLALDSVWAASPLLLLHKLGGWALMCVVGLAFLPFGQRLLILGSYGPRGGRSSDVNTVDSL
jgi:tRNA A-37 threonylcarbamoyl transferase component Bud32